MTFRIHALPAEPFEADFQLDDATLRARGIRRIVADGKPHYPCRVSLQDAVEGEQCGDAGLDAVARHHLRPGHHPARIVGAQRQQARPQLFGYFADGGP